MRLAAALTAAILAIASPAAAQTLRIGTAGAVTSIDPHFFNYGPNDSVAEYMFNPLIDFDHHSNLIPALALSWTPVEDGEAWEFKLRQDVVFHDGSKFTAADVVATFARVPTITASPSSFAFATKPVTRLEVIDPYTIRMHTGTPLPLLPYNLPQLMIVRAADQESKTEDFNSGKAAVGTGPYKLVSYASGDRLQFVRNDAYWGDRPAFDKVEYRIITNGASRTAALQAGDVDAIDGVSTKDVATLQKSPDLTVMSAPGLRLIYMEADSRRDDSPFVTAADGTKLDRNPLKDVRVRKALSLAVNREGIKRQIMDGFSAPTGQLMPEGASGYDPGIPADPYDPAKAKTLLAEAGYPNGFGVTLNGPNDRYVNDRAIIEAVAQMWTRIGVKTIVQTMPAATFFGQANKDTFSTLLTGWLTDTGEASSPLNQILASSNPDKGRGLMLRVAHYANPELDRVYEDSLRTLDTAAREALYREATRIGMADQAIIPVHHQVNIWAMRKPLTFNPRVMERTLAWDFSKP